MKSVLVRLEEYSAGAPMSAAESGVVEFLQKQPRAAAELSIHTLAQRTFSSPSTIVRMCHRLGFDGYKEFRRTLQYELAVRDRGPRPQSGEISPADALDVLAEKVTALNAAALQDTLGLLDPAVLRRSVDLLCAARTIGVFGCPGSQEAARDACFKLLRLGRACAYSEDERARTLLAGSLGRDDAALVLCYTGADTALLDCARTLRAHDAPVIAVTRFSASPLTALADCCLYTAAGDSQLFSGEMSSRAGQMDLVDILYAALACRSGAAAGAAT